MDSISILAQNIKPLAEYPHHSRIHALKSFSSAALACYVKRDDELGFGITGSKLRKYLSLIPYLKEQNIDEAILIGGAYSNNITSLIQLLIENNIRPTLFLLGNESYKVIGNLLVTKLFVTSDSMHWVSRKDWPKVHEIAKTYADKQRNASTYIIPEGALMPEALPGSLTLALDILINEQEHQIHFDHIFIDAGTGLTAISLILANCWLNKTTQIHVLLLADNAQEFIKKLQFFHEYFEQIVSAKVTLNNNYQLYIPENNPSFGSSSSSVYQAIFRIARAEGFLTDPIYSAKLFIEVERIIKINRLTGNALIIHSGGCLTLMGFQEQMFKQLKSHL